MQWLKAGIRLHLLAVLPFLGGCATSRTVQPGPGISIGRQIRTGDRVEISLKRDRAEARPMFNGRPIQPRGDRSPGAGSPFQARVAAVSTQGDWIEVEGVQEPVRLSLAEMATLHVYRDTLRPNKRLVTKSLVTGMITAGALGVISMGFSDECDGFLCVSDRAAVAGIGILAGGGIAIFGTIGGLLGQEEVWEEVPLPVEEPGLVLLGDGRVGLSFRVR